MVLNRRKNLHHKYRRIKNLKLPKKNLLIEAQQNQILPNLNKHIANIDVLPSTSFLTVSDINYLKTNQKYYSINAQTLLTINNFNYNLITNLTNQTNYQINNNNNNNNNNQKLLNKAAKPYQNLIENNYFKALKNNYRIANNNNNNNNEKLIKQKNYIKNIKHQFLMCLPIFNKCDNIFQVNKNNNFITKYLNIKKFYKIKKFKKFSLGLFNIKRFALLFFTFLTIFIGAVSSNWSDDIRPNTTYISQVLNRLTDRSKYDKRLRPRYGEGHVDVGITIHVSSISAVSEVDMDFTLDFYLRQTWYDPRLAFGHLDVHGFESLKSLTVGVDYLDKLWKPDTFFPNEKKSFFHTATTHNSFLRIEADGRIYTSQRLTVTATCPMHLRLFPMDSQTCKLEIESYGYTINDISYYWGEYKNEKKRAEDAVAFGDFSLPQFRPIGFRIGFTNATTSSGVYDRLNIQVILGRNLGFYLMNIVIPSMLIVSISWVSFWLSREASPARVGLGVTTVLTMTTLITTTNNSMPKVSYIKGLDVYLNFCFVMVFASLVEYAVVSYWNKRQCRLRERRRKRGVTSGSGNLELQQLSEMPLFTNYPTTSTGGLAVSPPPTLSIVPNSSTQNYVYRAPGLLMPTNTASGITAKLDAASNFGGPPSPAFMNISADCDCRTIPLMQYNDTANMYIAGANGGFGVYPMQPPTILNPYVNTTITRTRRRGGWRIGRNGNNSQFGSSGSYGPSSWCCRRFSPSKIDRCSRSMFPLMFIGFNCLYWSIMTFLSQLATNQKDFVPFKQYN